MEHQPSDDVLTPEQAMQHRLLGELADARRETAAKLAELTEFKAAVRRTVIANIKNGTICLAGANEALEEWGEQRYEPRYLFNMTVNFDVTVDAEDLDDARDEAYGSFRLLDASDESIYPRTSSIESWEVLGE